MKVKNIENLRNELKRNLDQLYFGNGYITNSSFCFYDEYDNDNPEIRHLDNVIEINKYKDDSFNKKSSRNLLTLVRRGMLFFFFLPVTWCTGS